MLRGNVGEPTYLSEQGFSDRPPHSAMYVGYFFYPYDLPIDRFALPSWVPGTTFYLIVPDRFANGDPTNDPAWVRPWGESPTGESFFGGDLAGIRSRLDWVKDLGAGGLYLTPVFTAPSTHKYDPAPATTDWHEVTGVAAWKLEIPGQGTRRVSVTHAVTAPKGVQVANLP